MPFLDPADAVLGLGHQLVIKAYPDYLYVSFGARSQPLGGRGPGHLRTRGSDYSRDSLPDTGRVIYRDFMLRKVADGLWCIGDADGIPAALVAALDDGTSLTVAEHWWSASETLLGRLAVSDTVREMLRRQGSGEDGQEVH